LEIVAKIHRFFKGAKEIIISFFVSPSEKWFLPDTNNWHVSAPIIGLDKRNRPDPTDWMPT
jgi:hypothetical protein